MGSTYQSRSARANFWPVERALKVVMECVLGPASENRRMFIEGDNLFWELIAKNSRAQIALDRLIACRANAMVVVVAATSRARPSSQGRTAARTSTTCSSRAAFGITTAAVRSAVVIATATS
jgi:hypothetical protein